MDAIDKVFYQSFFEELSSLEKNAMLRKEASIGRIISSIGSGLTKMRHAGVGGTGNILRKMYEVGAKTAPADSGRLGTALAGARKVLSTDTGKATAALGATGLGATGALGGAYALGRRGAEQ